MCDLLKEYSTEIGLSKTITLEELVDSHRSQRGLVNKYFTQDVKEIQERAQRLAETLYAAGYIKLSILETMTIQQVADLIGTS
jgi:hypothetical protein